MAQPVVPTTNKLRIKLKGVPRVQQSAAATYKGPAQAVRASLQLQDFRAAVDAFSKQGVHGLPEGMLLDPWNEEAVLQAQQEINPTLTAVQYPPSAARVRKRRAPGPAEICLADLGPDYVVWGRHKRQRSEQPKRLAKSPSQLSSSLQRMLASSSQPRTNSAQQEAPAAAAAKGTPSQQQQLQRPQQQRSSGSEQRGKQQQQQRHSLVQIPPRPPSPCLDDPMQWQPPAPVASVPAAVAPPQQKHLAPEETKQRQQPSAVEQPPRPAPEQPSAAAVHQSSNPQQPQGAPAAAPAAVESKQTQKQPQPAPLPRDQPSAQQQELQPARPADKQSPAQPRTAEPSVQQEQAQQSEYTDGIATRLRRRAAPEQPDASPAQQFKQQQKQAKGKQKQQQKQKAEASQDSGPPAKKARAAEGAQEPPASETASAPPAKPPAKAAAGKAATATATAAADAQKPAAAKAADKQVPAKAPAAPAKPSRGKAAAVKAAASPVQPAAAGKAGAAAKAAPASKDAAGTAAKDAQAAEAVAAAPAAEACRPAAAAAAAQAVKPESPPSETSHQQPITATMPQHLQLQPPLVPQLLQEQTAVSRDRSQCSLQQPVESPAAVASAGGRLGVGGGAGAAAVAGQGGMGRAAAGAGLAGAMRQPKHHLLELDAAAMTPAAAALGSLVVPPVSFRPLLPDRPFPDQQAAVKHVDGLMVEARAIKHRGDKRVKEKIYWDVHSLTAYARSVLEFLRYWDACQKAHKQLSDAGKPADQLKTRVQHNTRSGLLKQVCQLGNTALQCASNCKGQDVQKQAMRMLLERLTAICQLRHLHSQRESLSQYANTLKRAVPAASSSRPQQQQPQQQQQNQRAGGAGRPPVRAAVAAAAAAAGSSSPRGKQAFNKRSPDDSNTSHQDRVQMPHQQDQHSPGLLHHGGSPGAGAAGGAANAERELMIAESTCSEHLSELLKVTDGMHQTVMRMQQFLESPDVLADADARSAALHISTLGLDAGMFSIPRVVAHAEAALACIVRSGRLVMARTGS